MEKEYPRVAVTVFVIRDEKVLLGRKNGKIGYGSWGLPAGKLEFYESLEDCARRELEEETGLICDKMTFLHLNNDPLPNDDQTHWLSAGFLAEGVVGEPKLLEPDKCAEWKWFPLDNLPKDLWLGHKKSFPAYLKKARLVDAGKFVE